MQRKIIGSRPALNVSLRTAFPDSGMQGVHAMLDQVFSSGQTRVVHERAIAWDRLGNGVSELGYFDVIYQPIWLARE
jgi:hypothetical protein